MATAGTAMQTASGQELSEEIERAIRQVAEYAMARQAVNGRNMLPVHAEDSSPAFPLRLIRFLLRALPESK